MSVTTNQGAIYSGDGRCRFRTWAPRAAGVEIHILEPSSRIVPMHPDERGYFETVLTDVAPGALYAYRLDGEREFPDPASRSQPRGVHGPSEVVDTNFKWESNTWCGLGLRDYVIYEIHVGAFTSEGTFEAIIPHLDELRELGVTAIELMPVAQFPGERNWGYDGVFPYAPQNSYGGPAGLKRLVDACQSRGLGIVLDVVYNHFGPEGNFLPQFGPYFTDRYHTLWGDAINCDGPGSDEVRKAIIDNALFWVTDYHFDGLRLDAIDSIIDASPVPLVEELASRVHEQADQLKRRVTLFAETATNDARLLRSRSIGGYEMDAQWLDDFHHSIHTLLTGEKEGYYEDFGDIEHLAKSLREGYVYSGQYSTHFGRRRGSSSRDIPAHRFVVFAQNHDHVGNRCAGDRLTGLVDFESLKVAASLVLLSPFIPLIFMGEEYAEVAPFLYFVSHTDPDLVRTVREGRLREFTKLGWKETPPDAQALDTFIRSRLHHELKSHGRHLAIREFYRELLRLRSSVPALGYQSKDNLRAMVHAPRKLLGLRRWARDGEAMAFFNLEGEDSSIGLPLPPGQWERALDSSDARWQGPGATTPAIVNSTGEAKLILAPHSVAVYLRRVLPYTNRGRSGT